MRSVLVVSGKLTVGGAERVCRNIGYYADPTRLQIDYLVFGDESGAYEPELITKGCRVYHRDPPGGRHLKFYQELVRLLRENCYDVVHCHTMFNSGLVLRAAKSCNVPVRIAHSHSIRGPEHRGTVKKLYENTMRRWILKDATHYVACGRAAGEWLFGESAFREKGIVLLNGIELDRYRYDPAVRARIRREHGWDGCLVVGHTGHLAPVKNQHFLLELMPELLKRCAEARLILLGDGADRPMLEQTVRELGLENCVTMLGNVTNVNEYLSAMDVFVFPSLYEGMPLAVVEVQTNGLPCVLSDRVPKDVYLSDLLHPLPLEEHASKWADAILKVRRREPDSYFDVLQQSGFDVHRMLERLYQIYQG